MPDNNNVKISEDVIAVVAGVAATEVNGVAGLCSSGIFSGLALGFGKKSASKGVKVVIGDGIVIIDMHIIVKYGCKIPEVAESVQVNVRNEVETMTGMDNITVNVNIDEISVIEDKKQGKECP